MIILEVFYAFNYFFVKFYLLKNNVIFKLWWLDKLYITYITYFIKLNSKFIVSFEIVKEDHSFIKFLLRILFVKKISFFIHKTFDWLWIKKLKNILLWFSLKLGYWGLYIIVNQSFYYWYYLLLFKAFIFFESICGQWCI